MSAESHPLPLADQLRAALGWWREAGVDCAFVDEPHPWLGAPVGEADPVPERAPTGWEPSAPAAPPTRQGHAPAPAVPAAPAMGGERDGWPRDLAAFGAWWQSEPTLAPGGPSARILPRGPHDPELMILVPEPAGDHDTLLADGPQGALLAAMLRAMGIAADRAYLASALPAPLVGADWLQLGRSGLAAITAHHIALVQPRRLIAFGSNLWPLLWHEPAQAGPNLRIFNHDSGTVPVLAAPALERLVRRPADRRRLWQDWLEWTAQDHAS